MFNVLGANQTKGILLVTNNNTFRQANRLR